MASEPTTPTPGSSLGGLKSAAIICAVILAAIAPYTVVFGLRMTFHLRTEVFYYFLGLVIIPFVSLVVCAVSDRMIRHNAWRSFAIALGGAAVMLTAFVLMQWVFFDFLVARRVPMPFSWRAVVAGAAVGVAGFFLATWFIRPASRKVVSYALLLFFSLTVSYSAFHAFQFLPRFLQRGPTLWALKIHATEALVDEKAPAFTLAATDGEPYTLEQDRGKVVVVDFWATWCAPCVVAMPHLDKIAREMDPERVSFLAVSLDHDTTKVKPFMDSLGYAFTTLYGSKEMVLEYGIQTIPTTLVVDPSGVIRWVHVGYDDPMPAMLRTAIEDADE